MQMMRVILLMFVRVGGTARLPSPTSGRRFSPLAWTGPTRPDLKGLRPRAGRVGRKREEEDVYIDVHCDIYIYISFLYLLTGSIATRGKTAFFRNFARACQCFVMVRSCWARATTCFFDIFVFFHYRLGHLLHVLLARMSNVAHDTRVRVACEKR